MEYRKIGRRVFVGVGGYIGLVPSEAQKGETMCAFLGCDCPLVMRSAGNGKLKVAGDSYIPGVYAGETLLGYLLKSIQTLQAVRTAAQSANYGFRNNTNRQHAKKRTHVSAPYRSTSPTSRRSWASYRRQLIGVEPDISRRRGVDVRYYDLV